MCGDRNDWVEAPAGDARIIVNKEHPFAVIRRPMLKDVAVSWPDLDVGLRATSVSVLATPTGAWVKYHPHDSEGAPLPAGRAALVHVSPDGIVTNIRSVPSYVNGATRHGLWFSTSAVPRPADAAAWAERQVITLLRPDETTQEFELDRRVAFVFDDGAQPRLVMHDGAPQKKTDLRLVETIIPSDLTTTRLADIAMNPVDNVTMMKTLKQLTLHPPATAPTHDVVRWKRVTLAPEQQSAAVNGVLCEFEHLHTLSQGISESQIETLGEWPNTRVKISFVHPILSEGRVRRTINVFDGAGRVIPAMYASVHLMEDLDTRAPLDPASAKDGFVDF